MKLYSDTDAVDKVIPIRLHDLPGSFGQPYPIGSSGHLIVDDTDEDIDQTPILCQTISICNPGYGFPPPKKCPLHRPLLPMQLRNPGNWESHDTDQPPHPIESKLEPPPTKPIVKPPKSKPSPSCYADDFSKKVSNVVVHNKSKCYILAMLLLLIVCMP